VPGAMRLAPYGLAILTNRDSEEPWYVAAFCSYWASHEEAAEWPVATEQWWETGIVGD
jgi:hypothetical protein